MKHLSKFLGLFSNVKPFGIDPVTAITVGSAAVGAIGNLFGGDKEYTMEDLKKAGWKPIDFSGKRAQLNRDYAQSLKSRRSAMNQSAASRGLDPVQGTFAGESGLIDGFLKAREALDLEEQEYNNKVAMTLFQANQTQDDGVFANLLEGGITGANLGLKIGSVLNKPDVATGGDKPVPTTMPAPIAGMNNNMNAIDTNTTTQIGSEPTGLYSDDPTGIKKKFQTGYGNKKLMTGAGGSQLYKLYQSLNK